MGLKNIFIDGKDHLLGRLASVIAKQISFGHHFIVVRCEEIIISGGLIRQKMKYNRFLKKKHNSNPSRCGPIHSRSPASLFFRALRGMLPHKTSSGAVALKRVSCYEGVPPQYDKIKRMIIPDALKITNLKNGRAVVKLGQISHSIGWKYARIVEELETTRIERGYKYYLAKKNLWLFHSRSHASIDSSTK